MKDFDPFAPEKAEEYEHMAELRRECPISNLGEAGEVQYVATFDGVKKVLENCEKFEGSFGTTGDLPEDLTHLAAIVEPRHGQIRRIVNSVIAPHRTMGAEDFIRDLARNLLDDFVDVTKDSYGDIISAVSDPIPSTVIAYVLGFPLEHQEIFQRWSDELLEAMGADDTANRGLIEIHPELAQYVRDAIDERRASGKTEGDVIARFISTEIDGVRLSDDAICTQTIFLILSGNETTRNLLANCFYRLASRPEEYEAIKENPETIPAFVEESLRYDSPVKFVSRTCREALEVEGRQIQPEDRLILGINSANRDEKHFTESEDFQPKREGAPRSLAFGAGPHICPGASLARLEAVATMEEMVKKVAALEMQPDFEYAPSPTVWAHGPRELRVKARPK